MPYIILSQTITSLPDKEDGQCVPMNTNEAYITTSRVPVNVNEAYGTTIPLDTNQAYGTTIPLDIIDNKDLDDYDYI